MRTASLRGTDDTDEAAARRVATARWLYSERRRRDRTFGERAAAFRDPAWDMALDLYVAGVEGRSVSASSASIASATPMTTGLRCIEAMIRTGIAFRTGDPADARRSLVALTADARARMDRYLDGVD